MADLEHIIEVPCKAGCKRTFYLKGVTREQFDAWKGGMLIQKAMPQLSKEERELLISGTCGECWDKMFNMEEEE